MGSRKQSKDEHLNPCEHQSEKVSKSSGKRKRDYRELDNELQAKKVFVRKTKQLQKTGQACFGGSMVRNSRVAFHPWEMQKNIVHYVYQNMVGGTIGAQLKKCLQVPFVRSLYLYRLFQTASPFDRRITALEWHPMHPSTVAVGSKGGDIILWNYEVLNKTCFLKGIGAGGAITGMKFNPFNPSELYTSSVAGTTALQDFSGNTIRVMANTDDWESQPQVPISDDVFQSLDPLWKIFKNEVVKYVVGNEYLSNLQKKALTIQEISLSANLWERFKETNKNTNSDFADLPCYTFDSNLLCFWYCSVDVSATRRTVVTGDNVGNVILLSTEGEQIWNLKLHKKKVTHVEFNSHCDWLVATASIDQTVKIWDLRNIQDKSSCLHVLQHDKGVNAAYFSPTDGAKLLSTDQHNEIRVYSSSDWSKPQHSISHPHRQFQHLTPIKATWHPRYDLIVVGRYPDPKFPGYTADELRTVDIFDGNSGEMVCQLHDPNASGIISLNKFNPMGDILASGMGFNILIWDREVMIGKKQENLMQAMKEQRIGLKNLPHQRGHRQRQSNTETNKFKTKLLSLELEDTKTKGKEYTVHTKRKKDPEDL